MVLVEWGKGFGDKFEFSSPRSKEVCAIGNGEFQREESMYEVGGNL